DARSPRRQALHHFTQEEQEGLLEGAVVVDVEIYVDLQVAVVAQAKEVDGKGGIWSLAASGQQFVERSIEALRQPLAAPQAEIQVVGQAHSTCVLVRIVRGRILP